ncbi:unnamed protein product, partial [Rotaria sp. Silwood1]
PHSLQQPPFGYKPF